MENSDRPNLDSTQNATQNTDPSLSTQPLQNTVGEGQEVLSGEGVMPKQKQRFLTGIMIFALVIAGYFYINRGTLEQDIETYTQYVAGAICNVNQSSTDMLQIANGSSDKSQAVGQIVALQFKRTEEFLEYFRVRGISKNEASIAKDLFSNWKDENLRRSVLLSLLSETKRRCPERSDSSVTLDLVAILQIHYTYATEKGI